MSRTPSSTKKTRRRPLRTVAEVADWLELKPEEVRRLMKSPGEASPLMFVDEVAAELRVHRTTVYKMMERGELDYRLVGRRRRVRRQDLDLYVERAS